MRARGRSCHSCAGQGHRDEVAVTVLGNDLRMPCGLPLAWQVLGVRWKIGDAVKQGIAVSPSVEAVPTCMTLVAAGADCYHWRRVRSAHGRRMYPMCCAQGFWVLCGVRARVVSAVTRCSAASWTASTGCTARREDQVVRRRAVGGRGPQFHGTITVRLPVGRGGGGPVEGGGAQRQRPLVGGGRL